MNDSLPVQAPLTRAPDSATRLVTIPITQPLAPAQTPDTTTSLVIFQIAHQQYALVLDAVLEVVWLPALVALAGAPPTLCGLLNLRGRYLPVLSGRALVGEPVTYDLSNQIVIAGHGQPELGLLVDHVRDVCMIGAQQIAPIGRADVAPFLTSVFDQAEEAVLVFDLAALQAIVPSQRRRRRRSKASGSAGEATS
jgi:purine-binding chemotaxis protein CheW